MTPDRLKVKNEPIVRDTESGALLFTNRSEIEDYHRKRENRKAKEDSIKNEINNLKTDISEIKNLLARLIDRNPQ